MNATTVFVWIMIFVGLAAAFAGSVLDVITRRMHHKTLAQMDKRLDLMSERLDLQSKRLDNLVGVKNPFEAPKDKVVN